DDEPARVAARQGRRAGGFARRQHGAPLTGSPRQRLTRDGGGARAPAHRPTARAQDGKSSPWTRSHSFVCALQSWISVIGGGASPSVLGSGCAVAVARDRPASSMNRRSRPEYASRFAQVVGRARTSSSGTNRPATVNPASSYVRSSAVSVSASSGG